ncbi:MAG: hypothetical protein CSYNP_01532 [Syntrophus sp. SKADARSKE-3]|nr:hypothetical protein [Syntrophus sp. SKADARSKE-3]
MDVNYINPFLNGTLEVLHKMAFVEAVAGRPYTKADSTACGDVSGIIGITGGAVGSLAISFSEQSILSITGNMLGETYKDICRDVFDTVGELTNMISGVSRTHLEREGLIVYAAIPTVVYGKNHVIMHILKSPSIVIPFSTKYGQFFVDVCIKLADPAELVANTATGPINIIYKSESRLPGQGMPAPQPPRPAAQQSMSPTHPSATDQQRDVPRPAQSAAAPPPPTPGPSKSLTQEEKMARARETLEKLSAQRDETMKLLKDNPFMGLQQRQNLKKMLPLYEEKIKRLKLDIKAIESLMSMTEDDLDNPKIGKHFQNYPTKK